MRLTVFTDYALRILMYVGANPGRLCTISEIAQSHGISHAHLTKVTHLLAKLGYLETQRGKGGGMHLARSPSDINLGKVVREIEPDFDLVQCFTQDDACRLSGNCQLTHVLREALSAFLQVLDRQTLRDLLNDGPSRAQAIVLLTPVPRSADSDVTDSVNQR